MDLPIPHIDPGRPDAYAHASGRDRGFGTIFASPTALVACSLLYAWAIAFAHARVLSDEWVYFGFTYVPIGMAGILYASVLVAIGALAMPTRLDRPSALVLFMLFAAVFVPCVVITLGLTHDSMQRYGLMLASLTVSFVLMGTVSRRGPSLKRNATLLPPDNFILMAVIVWLASTAILILAYRGVMRFANLGEIYEQRFAIERDVGLLGYLRSYYANVFSPALLALGIVRRRYLVAGLGLVGAVVSYMIDAQKAALLVPALMIAFSLALQSRLEMTRTFALAVLLLGVLSLLVVLFGETAMGDFLERYFFVRAIAIPALTISQYYDLFDRFGLTWWSNLTGLGLVIPRPEQFANDPQWPALGLIVGDYYYGARADVNVNANPFSGEGVAAAKWFGVLVVGVVMSCWLWAIDRAAKGWNAVLVLLVTLPVAVALTNAHLSTTLVSFGGAAWLALMYYYKPASRLDPGGAV